MRAFASRYWLVGVLATLLAQPLSVAQAETITDTLSSAYSTNPDLGAQRARLRQFDENVAQALSNWRPQIRLTGEYGRSWFRNNTTVLQWQKLHPKAGQIEITQPIYRGGRTVAQTQAAKQDVYAERQALLAQEQTVLLAAATAYSDVVTQEAVVKLRANNVNVLGQQQTATNARFRVGELTRTDVSQAEARLAGAQSDLTLAQAVLAAARANYLRVVGVPPGTLVEAVALGEVPKTEEQAITLAAERNPNVLAASFREAAARYRVDQAIGALLPSVSIVGTATRLYDSNIEGDRVDRAEIVGQISIPIYQGGGEYSQVRAAKQVVGQRRLELDSARRQAIEQATRVWRRLEAERARVRSLTSQINASSVALEGVRQEAQVGSRTTLDVLDAEQELLNARVNLAQTQRDALVQHYTLLAAIGSLSVSALNLPVERYDEEEYYRQNSGRWIGLGPSINK